MLHKKCIMPAQIDFHKKCIMPSQIDFLHKMPKLDVDDSYIKNFVNDLLYAFSTNSFLHSAIYMSGRSQVSSNPNF